MNHTHKSLLKKLHEKYPKKHISIALTNHYFNHSDKYKSEYFVYVEDVYGKHFPTLSDVRLCVESLCKKGV